MVVVSRDRAQLLRHWKDETNTNTNTSSSSSCSRDTGKETTMRSATNTRKVEVVYYLSRNGHLEHPHFMEVSLTATHGLYLRDVINRLNVLRGRALVKMYSWSSKRSYKSGFVWHDLTDDDFIHPVNGNEYILKGTLILHPQHSPLSSATALTLESAHKINRDDHRTIKTMSSFDTDDCTNPQPSTNASIQTHHHPLRPQAYEETDNEAPQPETQNNTSSTELSRGEISPPPSSSSPETLETLIKADCRRARALRSASVVEALQYEDSGCTSGRMKASSVLMQLLSCGSIAVKEHMQLNGVSMVSQCKAKLARGGGEEGVEGVNVVGSRFEEKEYFSGSLVETKKMVGDGDGDAHAQLKRSSSFNADRGLKMDLSKEIEGVRARCIPRKVKNGSDGNPTPGVVSRITHGHEHGSKRINYQPPLIS